MLPDTFKDKSCILLLSIKELIGVIAKDYPLRDFQIIVSDNDIITENSVKNNYRRDIKYESNYVHYPTGDSFKPYLGYGR